MKLHLIPAFVLVLAVSAFAGETVTLTNVHDCCNKCKEGLKKAVAEAPGVTAEIEKTTVVLKADNKADLQKAVDSIVAAGFTGASDNADVKVKSNSAPDEKVKSLTVSGVHMCCGKCVTAAKKAIKGVAGVESDTITKGEESFKVEGDFNAKELMAALETAGFTGTAK